VRVKVWTEDPGARKRRPFDFEVEYLGVGRKERFETSFKGMAAFLFRAILHARSIRSAPPALVFSVIGIPAGLAGSLISRFAGAPHAVWYHGSDIHAGRTRGPGRFHRLLLRRIWKRAAVNFFVSQGLQDMASAMGNPQRPTLLRDCPAPEILAYPLAGGELPEKRYFLFLGRFDPVKNPMLALEAMLLLKAQGAPIRKLYMVGSGALGSEVHKFVRMKALSGTVALEAAASFDRVPELLRSAYALVVPSRMEGFNTTLLEAAHFGVPAVAADTLGIRDFVRHDDTGILFRENDAAALAEALRNLAADPERRDALGRNARKAAASFRPEIVVEEFLAGVADLAPGLGAISRMEGAHALEEA
jgi:glycosyltransferase involved in cell wall biosynthesis